MECCINTSNHSFDGTSDDVNFDVPLFATYFNMLILLGAMPTIIIPAVLVIRIILTTEKLHTVYYLFVISLLATDILNTFKMGFEFILTCLYIFGINADSTVSFVTYAILTIPRIAARFSFINLALDRVIAIALPYRHKSIITYRRAYAMIMFTWIISTVMCLAAFLSSSFTFVGPFGEYTPTGNDNPIAPVLLFLFVLASSIIIIVCINIYLYVQINKSKHLLEENMRTHGTDDGNERNENKQAKKRYHKLRKQVKTTLLLLILGGVDGMINLTNMMLLIIIKSFSLESFIIYVFQFVVHPTLYIQLISHSLLYGVYMKDIRRSLCKCYLCQRLKRAFPLRPSKVIVLNK